MDPTIWGPKAWFFIHNVALLYPKNPSEEDKRNYKTFFISLGEVLPCPSCRTHYKSNVEGSELDKALASNIDLFKWSVDLHNKVNKDSGKKEMSYEEALICLNTAYNRNDDNYYLIMTILLVVVVSLIILNKK